MFNLLGGNYRTFKKVKIDEKGSMKKRLNKPVTLGNDSLGSNVDLAKAVKCPKGESKDEWLAVHVVDFINGINILYGSVIEHCTNTNCPKMIATEEFEYMWMNKKDKKYQKPTSVTAPVYFELLMNWIEEQVNDDKIFPSDPSVPFPSNFQKIVKDIFKRLFRIYAHLYHTHLKEIANQGEEAHLNTCFKHFMFFVFEFELIKENEIVVLEEQIGIILGEEFKNKLKNKK
eukprot:gene7202-11518_t